MVLALLSPRTYLNIALGGDGPASMPTDAMLEPFKRMSENYRVRLRDMWNLRALTHTQTEGTELEHGCPREQGHYGFMLTDFYLLPLLTGLTVDMRNASTGARLELNPRFPPPYVLPVLQREWAISQPSPLSL